MSDAGDAKDQQQRALLTLTLAGSPRRDERRKALREEFGFEPMRLARAIATLGSNRGQGHAALRPQLIRALHRVAVHHPEYIVPTITNDHDSDLPSDDLGEPTSVTEALASLHEALAVEAGVDPSVAVPALRDAYDALVKGPPVTIDEPVGGSKQPTTELEAPQRLALTEVPGLPKEIEPPPTIAEAKAAAAAEGDPIGTYEVAVATALGIDIELVSAPLCEDRAGATAADAHSVQVCWTTKATIDQLVGWTDPTTWPLATNGVFFKAMTLIGNKTTNGKNWIADFTETVQFSEFSAPIDTALRFAHVETQEVWDDTADPNTFVWSTYALVDPNDPSNELTADDGLLQLRRVEYDNGETRVEATCTKNFRFKAPSLDGYAELACDTWFGELAIMMSTNCGNGYTN